MPHPVTFPHHALAAAPPRIGSSARIVPPPLAFAPGSLRARRHTTRGVEDPAGGRNCPCLRLRTGRTTHSRIAGQVGHPRRARNTTFSFRRRKSNTTHSWSGWNGSGQPRPPEHHALAGSAATRAIAFTPTEHHAFQRVRRTVHELAACAFVPRYRTSSLRLPEPPILRQTPALHQDPRRRQHPLGRRRHRPHARIRSLRQHPGTLPLIQRGRWPPSPAAAPDRSVLVRHELPNPDVAHGRSIRGFGRAGTPRIRVLPRVPADREHEHAWQGTPRNTRTPPPTPASALPSSGARRLEPQQGPKPPAAHTASPTAAKLREPDPADPHSRLPGCGRTCRTYRFTTS